MTRSYVTIDSVVEAVALVRAGERDTLAPGPYRAMLERLLAAGGWALTTHLRTPTDRYQRIADRLDWLQRYGLVDCVRPTGTSAVYWYFTRLGLDAIGSSSYELIEYARERRRGMVDRRQAREAAATPTNPHWHGDRCPRCQGPLLHDREDFPDRMCFTCGFVAYHRRVQKGLSTAWNQD